MGPFRGAVVDLQSADGVVAEVFTILQSIPGVDAVVLSAGQATAARVDLIVLCCGVSAMANVPLYVAQCRGRNAQRHVLLVSTLACERELGALLKIGVSDFVRLPLLRAELHTRVERALGLYPCGLNRPLCQWLTADEPMLCSVNPRVNAQLARIPMLAGRPQHVVVTGEAGTGRRAFVRQIAGLSGAPVAVELDPERVAIEQMAPALERGLGDVEGGAIVIAHDFEALPAEVQGRLLREVERAPDGSGSLRLLITAGDPGGFERPAARVGSPAGPAAARVRMPPLRERRDDVLPLARLLMLRRCAELGRSLPALTPAAARFLLTHPWPGNVRELWARMNRGLQHAPGELLSVDDLAGDFDGDRRVPECSLRQSKTQLIVSFERSFLEQLLEACQGNIAKAARVAHKNRRALFELIRKHDIDVDRFRPAPTKPHYN